MASVFFLLSPIISGVVLDWISLTHPHYHRFRISPDSEDFYRLYTINFLPNMLNIGYDECNNIQH